MSAGLPLVGHCSRDLVGWGQAKGRLIAYNPWSGDITNRLPPAAFALLVAPLVGAAVGPGGGDAAGAGPGGDGLGFIVRLVEGGEKGGDGSHDGRREVVVITHKGLFPCLRLGRSTRLFARRARARMSQE
ncbi:MAG: hypothetical protein ACRD1H_03760, partial [Vicinamibacterales bacterium]